MKNIFLLKRINETDWDEARGFVVIASSSGYARLLAAEQAGDEGPDVWHNPEQSSCELIGVPAPAHIYPAGQENHIVLRDFKAG